MIRHACSRSSPPILLLPVAMIQPSLVALLVTVVGATTLPDAGFGATRGAAIALSAIAMPTDPEHRVTLAAKPLTENRFAVSRHVRPQAG